EGGQPQGGDGEDVAQGGDEGGGDVVEVPAVAHRPGGQDQGGDQHGHRRQEPAQDGDEGEVEDRGRPHDPEADSHDLGHHGEQERHGQSEQQRRLDVLPHEALAAQGEPEDAGVDGGGQPVAHGGEDVAPQADGRRYE